METIQELKELFEDTRYQLQAEREVAIMDAKAYKKVEIIGTSQESFAKAADNAVKKASKSLHHLDWFEVSANHEAWNAPLERHRAITWRRSA